MPPQTSLPVAANFPSEKLTIGAGVAIFHLASERIVVCYHSRDRYWFLPKGRRNANEDTGVAAEREGFEESGYRNRLLPLPLKHRQPQPDEGREEFVKEPIWTQLVPVTATSQYMLFWYVAETVPGDVEASYAAAPGEGSPGSRAYVPPPKFPANLTFQARIAQDQLLQGGGESKLYEPVRHEGTGVNDDELLYKSYLLSVDDACKKLKGTVMEDVVRRGWAGIQLRLEIEADRVPSGS